MWQVGGRADKETTINRNIQYRTMEFGFYTLFFRFWMKSQKQTDTFKTLIYTFTKLYIISRESAVSKPFEPRAKSQTP